MKPPIRYGLEQARIHLPLIASEAHAGSSSVITRHGKPYAAVVPVQDLETLHARSRPAHTFVSLRGTGKGLWTRPAGESLARLRSEWDEREPG